MNYSLGRTMDRDVRLHVNGCKKCQARVRRLESQVLDEGLEFRGQAAPLQARAEIPAKSRKLLPGARRLGKLHS